jgi:nucleoside-diphosphate-sugar epimerase
VRSGNEEPGHVFTEADWNEVALPLALREGKATPGPITYTASKVASEKAFWAFVEEAKPAFKAAAINPVFIYGPPLTVPHSREQVGFTYRHIFDISAGSQIPEPALGFPWFVDVRDVARLVVFAVENPDKTNGQRYIAAKAYAPPQAVADVLRKRLPERKHIIAEGKPGEGYIAGYTAPPDLGYDIDTSKSEIETGVPYIDFETSVLDTVEALKSLW